MPLLFFSIVWIAIASFNVLRYYCLIGYPSRHSILPFQAGTLYRRGHPVRQVGPGSHRVFVGIEKIIFLDTRPIPVNSERRGVTLADGAFAVYSFAASAEVSDVSQALKAAANYTQVPAFVILSVARAVLNQSQSDEFGFGRALLEEKAASLCRSRLSAAGFRLLSFQFTELSIAAPAPAARSLPLTD
jgi:hypothetical protein